MMDRFKKAHMKQNHTHLSLSPSLFFLVINSFQYRINFDSPTCLCDGGRGSNSAVMSVYEGVSQRCATTRRGRNLARRVICETRDQEI